MSHPVAHAPLVYVAGKLIGLALAPLSIILLPGFLGEAAYGKYSYWFGLIAVYIVIIDLGGQSVLRRFLPQIIQQNPRQAGRLFWITQQLKLLPLVLLITALLFGRESSTTLLLLGTALIGALANNCADIYYVYQQMALHSLAVLSRRFLRLLLVPVFFLIWGLPGILAALLVAELIGLMVSSPAIQKLPQPSQPLDQSYKEYYQQGFLLFFSFLIATITGRLPVFMSEWGGISAAKVGQLALCVDITYFALKELINALTESIYPKLIQLHYSDEKQQTFSKLVAFNYRILNFTALGVSAIGIGLTPGFLALLGGEFYQAEFGLQLILFSLIFSCWNNLHGHLQMIKGRAKQIFLAQVVGILSNLVCIGFFWQRQTILTLSIALTIGMIFAALSSFLDVRKLFSYQSSIPCFIRLLPACILVVVGLQLWNPRDLWSVLVAGIIACLCYLALALLSQGLPKEDLQLIVMTIKQRKV